MKPYVICHMMPSVDGRLRTDRWDIPKKGHQEYERTADTYKADAWVCGRKTMEEFARGRRGWSRARTAKIPRTDYVEGDPLVVVVTKDVADGYLRMLREKGISYCFAGNRAGSLDLAQALEKLRTKFGVRRLMLEGGGE